MIRHAILFGALLTIPAASVDAAVPVTLPIELEQGLIIATVKVGRSRPFSFLVDTGAEATVLAAESLGEMGLDEGQRTAASVQGGETEAHAVHGARIVLGPVTLAPKTVMAIPLARLASSIGRRIDGIIGYELFERYIVEIRYDRRQMVLRPANAVMRGGAVIPISIRGRTPFIAGTLVQGGRPVAGRLLVDTGGTTGLTLYQPFVSAHPGLVPPSAVALTGGAILPGRFKAQAGRLQEVRIGPFRMKRPVTNFSSSAAADDAMPGDAGQIGAEILRRFSVTVDYPHRRILLAPGRALDAPFEFDASGASLAAVAGDLRRKRVRLVLPGTPAEEAGLKAGDILREVDGVAAETLPLGRIRSLFRIAKRTYRLKIDRDGHPLSVELRTRTLV